MRLTCSPRAALLRVEYLFTRVFDVLLAMLVVYGWFEAWPFCKGAVPWIAVHVVVIR